MSGRNTCFGLVLGAAVIVAACGDGNQLKKKDALTSRQAEFGVSGQISYKDTAGTVILYTADTYKIRRPVVLRTAKPLRISPGAELLATRVSFQIRGPKAINGSPGDFCVDWPPRGYGPTFAVRGLKLQPGWVPAINFFVRPTEVGDQISEGVAITYLEDGELYRHTSNTMALKMKIVRTKEEVKPDGGSCTPGPSLFTGHGNIGEKFREIEKTPPKNSSGSK